MYSFARTCKYFYCSSIHVRILIRHLHLDQFNCILISNLISSPVDLLQESEDSGEDTSSDDNMSDFIVKEEESDGDLVDSQSSAVMNDDGRHMIRTANMDHDTVCQF